MLSYEFKTKYMFDIFKEPQQPMLYIADIHLSAKLKIGRSSKYETKKIILIKNPVILLNGNFPTENAKRKFLKNVFLRQSLPGDFDNIVFSIEKISNIKFSSKLMYKFDFSQQ